MTNRWHTHWVRQIRPPQSPEKKKSRGGVTVIGPMRQWDRCSGRIVSDKWAVLNSTRLDPQWHTPTFIVSTRCPLCSLAEHERTKPFLLMHRGWPVVTEESNHLIQLFSIALIFANSSDLQRLLSLTHRVCSLHRMTLANYSHQTIKARQEEPRMLTLSPGQR